MKEKKYPSVKFVMSEFISVTGNSVKVKGKLIVAGTEKSILLEAAYAVNGDSVQFRGAHEIAFTDFKIDPPTAVFGTIKTGDILTLGFETSFSPIN
ncbi:YceI family protein [Algoriphagus pacificus]|nr:YceI family protein [Algoriphagus pacificus]